MKTDEIGLLDRLADWAQENRMLTPGAVCVALVVTRHSLRVQLPLDVESLISGQGGQIVGLGRRTVQAILAKYGVTRVLAVAGGRTSRGNVHKMRAYVAWLNANVSDSDLTKIEQWWACVAEKTVPYQRRLRMLVDQKLSLRTTLRSLLAQAAKCNKRYRRDGSPMHLRPAREAVSTEEKVLKYLVGAKLELVLGREVEAHGAFVADTVTARSGDYQIEDVVIHVTTSPGEALLRKCSDNLEQGLRPLVITTFKNVTVAETMAENAGVAGRVEFFDVEQFVASNILELSKFSASGRKVTAQDLIARYNRLAGCENNPGLLIKEA